MCGIFGYAGEISSEKSKIAHELLASLASESESRGIDSTGFSCKHSDGYVVSDKMPYRARRFVRASHKFKRLKKRMPNLFIGHTRLGTGSTPLINNNNHPFYGTHYHMVHNGVIPSWRDIQRRHELSMTSETDSEVILRFLEKQRKENRTKEAVEKTFADIYGNMAVALLDIDNPTIWLFRNDNPIYVFTIPDDIFGGEVYFFASLDTIFNEAWKNVFKKGFKSSGVSSDYLRPNKLYSISTNAKWLEGEGWHKFIVFNLEIPKSFSRPHQYSKCYSHTPTTSKYFRKEDFFSEIINEKKPQLGCNLSDSQVKDIEKKLSEKDGKKRVRIDGMTVDEYAGLKTLVSDLFKIETSHFLNLNSGGTNVQNVHKSEGKTIRPESSRRKADKREPYSV